MTPTIVRRLGSLIVALVGGYLLYLSANPDTGARTAVIAFGVGIVLFLALLAALQAAYRPGRDEVSDDEILGAPEWKVARFLRRARDAAPFYLGIRLFLAYEWIDAAREKLSDPTWMKTGDALRGFWARAVQVPAPPARPPITYPAYRSFIQYMLDHQWYTWFAKVVAIGELVIGIALVVGGLTAIAAFGGLLMNFNYVYAGTAATNPTMIILEALIIFGWRASGWWGLDRFLLPHLGTPWSPRAVHRPPVQAGRRT